MKRFEGFEVPIAIGFERFNTSLPAVGGDYAQYDSLRSLKKFEEFMEFEVPISIGIGGFELQSYRVTKS